MVYALTLEISHMTHSALSLSADPPLHIMWTSCMCTDNPCDLLFVSPPSLPSDLLAIVTIHHLAAPHLVHLRSHRPVKALGSSSVPKILRSPILSLQQTTCILPCHLVPLSSLFLSFPFSLSISPLDFPFVTFLTLYDYLFLFLFLSCHMPSWITWLLLITWPFLGHQCARSLLFSLTIVLQDPLSAQLGNLIVPFLLSSLTRSKVAQRPGLPSIHLGTTVASRWSGGSTLYC